MLKSHKNDRDNRPPFLLTDSCEAPPPTPYCLFQLKLKKNLSVCYILLEVGAWSNVILYIICQSHFKIGINKLLHYSIWNSVHNMHNMLLCLYSLSKYMQHICFQNVSALKSVFIFKWSSYHFGSFSVVSIAKRIHINKASMIL